MILELFLLSFILLVVYWYLAKPKDLPPGPTGLPLLGYLPWLLYYARQRTKMLQELKNKYGPIVCIRAGFSYSVFLNDVEIIKDALTKQGDDFSHRGLLLFQQEITNGKGILTADGKTQREHRRFILKTLRNLGFGKVSFEEHIMESVITMRVAIDAHLTMHPLTSEPMDIQRCLTEAVADNICRIVLGQKFNSEELNFMITRLDMISRVPPALFLINSFPFLLPFMKLKFFRRLVGVETFKEIRKPLEERIDVYVKQHKQNFDKEDLSDFIYSYLNERESHHSSKEEEFSWDDEQIKHACTELIAAGTATTEATTAWILCLVARYQTWQSRIHREIDSVVGRTRYISTRDLPHLPLCDATILETLRWSILASAGIPHATPRDTRLRGFFIPAHSAIFPNLYATTRDTRIWQKPHDFDPAANFLSPDGNKVINRENLISFGIGRRSCIGESLARMEVTMFFLNLLQTYSVHLSPHHGFPEVNDGIFRIPSHRWLVFKKR